MRQAGEPSVEEILESIKKVIARDNRAGAAIERKEREERGLRSAPAQVAPPDRDDDVLELDSQAVVSDDEPDEAPLLPEDRASSMRERVVRRIRNCRPPMKTVSPAVGIPS